MSSGGSTARGQGEGWDEGEGFGAAPRRAGSDDGKRGSLQWRPRRRRGAQARVAGAARVARRGSC